MSELKRQVVVERDDDIAIFLRQPQRCQREQAVPIRRSQHHCSLRVRPADHRQHLSQISVPIKIELAVRLIQWFKVQSLRLALIALRDLRPQRQVTLFVFLWLLKYLLIVVHVDNHHQVTLQRVFHHPIHPLKEGFVNRVRRFGKRVIRPANGNTHRIKSGISNQVKEALFQHHAPLAFFRRFQCISQVHAAPNLPSLFECVHISLRQGTRHWRWFGRKRWENSRRGYAQGRTGCGSSNLRRSIRHRWTANRTAHQHKNRQYCHNEFTHFHE